MNGIHNVFQALEAVVVVAQPLLELLPPLHKQPLQTTQPQHLPTVAVVLAIFQADTAGVPLESLQHQRMDGTVSRTLLMFHTMANILSMRLSMATARMDQ